jgi:hypothetical protein
VSYAVTDEQKEKVEQAAHLLRVSASEIVRNLIDKMHIPEEPHES